MNYLSYDTEDAIMALATAYTQSAIAIIRLSGKDCLSKLANAFSPSTKLLNAAGNSIIYGKIVDSNKKSIDEVLVSVFRAPKSYTGQESAEINCHGSLSGINEILNCLEKVGFRQAGPGEFTLRAFLSGKLDLSRAEAVNEIVRSKTIEAHTQSLNNLSGNIFNKIDSLKKDLLKIYSSIEIQLDYAEDDFDDKIIFPKEKIQQIYNETLELVKSFEIGKLYRDGITIALAGKTNAGKSSLFNLFLKEDRSIVSNIHGTTRDYLESWLSFKGIPIKLYDTAGIREAKDLVEIEGIKRTENIILNSSIILYIIDATIGVTDEDKHQIEKLNNKNVILVFNKSDLLNDEEKNKYKDSVLISSTTSLGLSELETVLFNKIKNSNQNSLDIVISSERQKKLLDEVLVSLKNILDLKSITSLDGIALDMKCALDSFGKITGEVTTDDILDSIFSNFCVGK